MPHTSSGMQPNTPCFLFGLCVVLVRICVWWRQRHRRTKIALVTLFEEEEGGSPRKDTTYVLFPGLWMSPRVLFDSGTFEDATRVYGVRLRPESDFDAQKVAEWVRTQLAGTDLKSLHIVGFSMGAVPACHLARMYPGCAVTLVAPGGGPCRTPLARAARVAARLLWLVAGAPRVLTQYPTYGHDVVQGVPKGPRSSFTVIWGSEDAVHPPDWSAWRGCTQTVEMLGDGHWSLLRRGNLNFGLY